MIHHFDMPLAALTLMTSLCMTLHWNKRLREVKGNLTIQQWRGTQLVGTTEYETTLTLRELEQTTLTMEITKDVKVKEHDVIEVTWTPETVI